MNKKMICLLAGAAAMAWTGCSEPEFDGRGEDPNGDVVRVEVNAPDVAMGSRAVEGTNSGRGGLTNVDWSEYDLRYQLAVYDETGAELLVPAKQVCMDAYGTATFEFRLTPERKYKFVAWADFVKEGETTDLHYNTADLTKVTLKDDETAQVNDESRDAYFATKDVTVPSTAGTEMVLKRPFAKLRVVTTDWGVDGVEMPEKFEVTYKNCTRFEGLNAVTGKAISKDGKEEGTTLDETGVTLTAGLLKDGDGKFYAGGYDMNEQNRTLTVDYLVVNNEQQPVHFTMEMQDGEGTVIVSRDFETNIPLQRNYLTTILGNLMSTGEAVTVSIEEGFAGEYNALENWAGAKEFGPLKEPAIRDGVYHVTTVNELAWLAKYDAKDRDLNDQSGRWTEKVKHVVIDNDLDLKGINWDPIDIIDKEVVFDGNNKVIRNLKINYKELDVDRFESSSKDGRYYFGLFGTVSMNKIQNVTVENVTIEGLGGDELPYPDEDGEAPGSNGIEFAGGVVGSMNVCGVLENCHARHVFIKSSSNAGGLVGYLDGSENTTVVNCTVEDVTLVTTSWDCGGFMGTICSCPKGTTRTVQDCRAKDVVIFGNTGFLSGYSAKGVSGFIGSIIGQNSNNEDMGQHVLKNCGVENVAFLNASGEAYSYEPTHELFGKVRNSSPFGALGTGIANWEKYVTVE